MVEVLYKEFQSCLEEISPGIHELTKEFDLESFESLYDSLKEDQQDVLLNNDEYDKNDRILIYALMAMRGKDYADGYTDLDDDGILHICKNSNVLELPITMAAFIELASVRCLTIGDAMQVNGVSDFVVREVEHAVYDLKADSTVCTEDF